jgi:hypothetical protein
MELAKRNSPTMSEVELLWTFFSVRDAAEKLLPVDISRAKNPSRQR